MTNSRKPFFSIIIPTYERPKDLENCLNSLSESIQKFSLPYEIIVTDDSVSHKSRELVKKSFSHTNWLKGKQNGPAGNRNAGASLAKGEWILFVDDDCVAQEGFLQGYFRMIQENPKIQVFEGRIFADRPKRTWAEGCPENEKGGMIWTSNLCLLKTLFEEIGGFDERFVIAYEDVDFAYRIKKKNIEVLFAYDASVCHPWRTLKTGGKNWKKKGYEFESLKLFVDKHGINDIANCKIYFRNLFRMLTRDQITSLFHFKLRGYNILLFHIYSTIRSLIFLIIYEWNLKKEKK